MVSKLNEFWWPFFPLLLHISTDWISRSFCIFFLHRFHLIIDHHCFSDFETNSTNPCYLHPNESLALIMVVLPLDNKNLHTRSRSMHIALVSKSMEKFVDVSFPKPPISNPLYTQWIRSNTMVLSWITLSFHIAIFFVSQTFKNICFDSTKVLLTSLNTLCNWKCIGMN